MRQGSVFLVPVGNNDACFADLYDGFAWFGPIANVKIVTDHYTGGPRGFG